MDLAKEFDKAMFEVRWNRYFEATELDKVKTYEKRFKKKAVRIFDLYKSIWAPRCKWADSRDLYDTDEVEFQRFTVEWEILLEVGLGKLVLQNDDGQEDDDEDGDGIPDEVEDVGMVLWNCHDLLHALFTSYAALSGDFISISLNAWTQFVEDFKLVNKKSKFCKRADMDLLFIEVNSVSKKNASRGLAAAGDNEINLSRMEFYGALVRLAIRRHILPGTMSDVSDALEHLILNDIHKKAVGKGIAHRVFVEANDFRIRHAYKEVVCDVLDKHETSLRNLFAALCKIGGSTDGSVTSKLDDKALISLDEWMTFLRKSELIQYDLSERDATLVFAWSRMIVVDARKGKGLRRDSGLPFEGFMEAVCRMSILKALPTPEELEATEFAGAGEFLFSMKDTEELKHMQEQRAVIFGDEPRQPLAICLEMVIDMIRFEVEKVTKAGKIDGVITEAEAQQYAKACVAFAAEAS